MLEAAVHLKKSVQEQRWYLVERPMDVDARHMDGGNVDACHLHALRLDAWHMDSEESQHLEWLRDGSRLSDVA